MLSATSEHALRALICLAATPEGESHPGRELAAASQVPPNYLAKILLLLKRAGLVDATRGSGGGYWLARPAEEIYLVDIVSLIEGTPGSGDCLLGGGKRCDPDDPCPAHRKWKRVRQSYLEFLEGTTLAEIARGHEGP